MNKKDEARIKNIEHRLEGYEFFDRENHRRIDALEVKAGIKYAPKDKYNTGDWTTFENIEIGDTVGSVKITAYTQLEILRAAGKSIKAIADLDRLGKVLNL